MGFYDETRIAICDRLAKEIEIVRIQLAAQMGSKVANRDREAWE
jgi:hypothetical protein